MLNSSFEYWHTFSRYFPFVVTTDSNNVACNFYFALALLFWSNFSGTLKNKSEQLVSNASLLARSGANEFGNKGFSGDRPLYCSIHIGLFYCVNVKHSGLNVKARQSSRGFLMMLVPQKRQTRKVLLLRLENSTNKARSHGLLS